MSKLINDAKNITFQRENPISENTFVSSNYKLKKQMYTQNWICRIPFDAAIMHYKLKVILQIRKAISFKKCVPIWKLSNTRWHTLLRTHTPPMAFSVPNRNKTARGVEKKENISVC